MKLATLFRKKGRLNSGGNRTGGSLGSNSDAWNEAIARRIHEWVEGYDRDHVWCFMAGHASQDFRGNPKYLFAYINKYRPDIKAYWLCGSEDTIAQVRALGFEAFDESAPEAQFLINKTGVLVTEQVKSRIPDGFENVKYINLWHGVGGLKRVERRQFENDLSISLAQKYVARNAFYHDQQMVNAPCPAIENEFVFDMGVNDDDNFLRAGYPRNLYQRYCEPLATFDHDVRKKKGLSGKTRIAVYAPTFRAGEGEVFSRAIPDVERLERFCREQDILLILKMHPLIEDETSFLNAKRRYGNSRSLLFWDNADDLYEIISDIDLAIVDYSSITADFCAAGVPHYIRYVFDYDEYAKSVDTHDAGQVGYFDRTLGAVCKSFDELIAAMGEYSSRDESADIARINEYYWSYSQGEQDFERIVQAVLEFEPKKRSYPTLYSFDIFDTLISRKVLDPVGVFYGVQERMAAEGGFPAALTRDYPNIRHWAELCEREYFAKSTDVRQSEHVEVGFAQIIQRIGTVYELSDEQMKLLADWEIELEIDNTIPLAERIEFLKSLLAEGEFVVLISDMYLPRTVITQMLAKADPVLAQLPLFLSNEYGVLKASSKLYFEVYKSFEPYYDFGKWVHYGDNEKADVKKARSFQISSRRVAKPSYNDCQQAQVDALRTYDSYLVAAMQARLCMDNTFEWDEFTVSFVSLCFVPYIDWVLRDAERRGYQTLYFVSRDGHHLKRIADAIIEQRNLPFKTKYIYASRRTWRIPSYIDEVDEGFWGDYGNFKSVTSKEKLFAAMSLDENRFRQFFPAIDPDSIEFSDKASFAALVQSFRDSNEYNEYLLGVAAEGRKSAEAYLLQEVDPAERFAFVEFNGRGYNQDCHVRLWQDAIGDDQAVVPYYYARSILPTDGCSVRHNFTVNHTRLFFIEAIFANMPYRSVESYEEVDGVLRPVIRDIPCNQNLFDSMNRLLPEFARRYAALGLEDGEATDHQLFDFALEFYTANRDNTDFADRIGQLMDSVLLYGKKREFAPALTNDMVDALEAKEAERGNMTLTSSITMSVTRATPDVRRRYCELYQILPGDDFASGRVLSEAERERNGEYREKYEEMAALAAQWRDAYDEASASNAVEPMALIVHDGKSLKTKGLHRAYNELVARGVDVRVLPLDATSIADAAARLASARVVLVDKPIARFADVGFREETKLILAARAPFSLHRKGLAAHSFLKWKRRYERAFAGNDFAAIQLASPSLAKRMLESYALSAETECDILGSCVTDLYFDMPQAEARRKLEGLFPACKGKRIVLYMPKLRKRNTCDVWADLIDFGVLSRLIGDQWCLVFNYNKGQAGDFVNLDGLPGFAEVITEKQMNLRELIIASDAVVGDYRDTYFESVITGKPVYSSAFDYEKELRAPSVDLDGIVPNDQYEKLVIGPLVKSAEDLAAELAKIESYDFSDVERMRELLFAYCDGESTKRLVDRVEEICNGK